MTVSTPGELRTRPAPAPEVTASGPREHGWSWGSAARAVGIAATLFFCLFPILWMLLTAFKNSGDAFTAKWIFTPTLENFTTIFSSPYDFGSLTVNSLIVSILTTVIGIPIATMAAYALSRFSFRGNRALLIGFLVSQFIPPVVIALPVFNVFETLGLLDTRTALIVMNLSIIVPYSIWMIKGFIDALPDAIEEAGFVDGCGDLGILRHITLPLAMPGILVSSVFAFVLSWNEFLYPFLLTRQDAKTATVGLLTTQGTNGVEWNLMSAAGLIVMVPVFVLSLFIRKHFTEGITMGAVK